MNRTVVAGSVTVTALLSGILLAQGSHTVRPAAIATPTLANTIEQGKLYSTQVFQWTPANDATGYRLYLDGKTIGNVGYVGSTMAITCGVQHRFNVQPFNNKGAAVLAAPLYFNLPCAP